jgi:glycosyltransferase involved in cell wall biosynthesis
MRISFISSLIGEEHGGAEISATLLMEKLIERGQEVCAITTRKIPNRNRFVSLPHSSLIPKRILTLGNTFVDRFLAWELAEKINLLNPDLLHIQDTNILPATITANREIRIPMVVTLRNNVSDWVYDMIFSPPFSLLLKRRNKVILRCLNEVNAIIAVSQYIKGELVAAGVEERKIYQVYNMHPTSSTQNHNVIHDSRIQLFALGWLSKYKGFHVLINAINTIVETNKNLQLTIAGNGPEKHNLERLVNNLGLTDFVQFVGHVAYEDIGHFYLNADIIILPSLHPEPFGRVALEAMFYGKPAVASSVGGIPEIVRDGETGILVPPNNHDGLANAIVTLIRNKRLRELMGKKGREIALTHFNADSITQQHIEIYEKTCRHNT